MNFLIIPALFLIWRVVDFIIIFLSQKVIPYLGFFPYSKELPLFHLPKWVSALANFDGLHYIFIARNGYSQFEQAFFPLYPILIKYLSPLFSNNELLTGLMISNVCFLIGLFVFYKYLKGLINQTPTTDYRLLIKKGSVTPDPYTNFIQLQPFITVLFLLVFPTSFFFGAVYTEGLFFLLLISTLYFLKKEQYFWVAIFAFLASMTRLIGVFLIIPIIFHIIQKSNVKSPASTVKRGEQNLKSKLKSFLYLILNTKYLLLIISPLLGMGLYCFYLWQTTGDTFYFLTSQPSFGANRSSHLILLPQVYWRYIKIFITAAHDSRFFISIIEFLIFNFVFTLLVLDLFKNLKIEKLNFNEKWKMKIENFDKLGLNLFSFSNLILPTLTGTFSSIPRYALFSISFFLYITQIKNNYFKSLIFIIFLVLHIILLGLFTQGYFVS